MSGLSALRDLAPLGTTVAVRGVELAVRPLSIASIVALAMRFKALAGVLEGGDIVQAVLGAGDEVVAAVIGASLGEPEHVVLELMLSGRLGPVEQASLLAAIAETSLPLDSAELLALAARVRALFGRVEALGEEVAAETEGVPGLS